MMKERTLRVLEFTKILDMLASFAVTDMGREACEKLTPLSDLAQVNEALEETEEAQVILTYLGDSPLIGFPDVRPYLTLAAKGAALNPKALLSVAECLRASRAARSALVTDRDNTPRITGLASHLQTFRQLEDAITGAIISEEELSDHASPQLADIRRHIKQSNERVREKLNSMVHGASFSEVPAGKPSSPCATAATCIPVKQEYRQFVPGLVHDQSGTGATLFIEPMAVVEAGQRPETVDGQGARRKSSASCWSCPASVGAQTRDDRGQHLCAHAPGFHLCQGASVPRDERCRCRR